MTPTVVFVFIGVIVVWLLFVSAVLWKMFFHYNRLTKGTSSNTLSSILDALLKDSAAAKKDIDFLMNRCDTIEKEGRVHIQKIGLLRFNPFKDTGGDQSFIIAFLNGENTGVVISGLYSRSGTRWYAKKIHAGVGVEHELSEEEKKAIKEAKVIA